jgi:phage-related protein
MAEPLKPVRFMGDSLQRLRLFPGIARKQAGYELEMVQHGQEPSDWKPMPGIGRGVNEIRLHADGEHRVFYVAKFARAIYVLHAIQKKAQKTPATEIELARARYREVLRREGPKS